MGDIMGGAHAARPKRVQRVDETPAEPAEPIDTTAIETRKVVFKPQRIPEPRQQTMSDLDVLEKIGDLLAPLSRARRRKILTILGRMV
jgi:hypothetical protein